LSPAPPGRQTRGAIRPPVPFNPRPLPGREVLEAVIDLLSQPQQKKRSLARQRHIGKSLLTTLLVSTLIGFCL
ncbi:MAG: hypothetical protein OQK12_17315, partial [Motiliproteus sp.]|nr:hypothetical protein [Motiliproteus sp.]